MAEAERLPLLEETTRGPSPAYPGKLSFSRIFLCCVALAVVAVSTARSFPRSARKGRASQQQTELNEARATPIVYTDEYDGGTLAPAHVTTTECTGDTSKPVARGVDVVAYRSLAAGTAAVYGSPKYSSIFGRYLFFFSSLENKLVFENDPVKYVPNFGGFCAYGISHEPIWNPDDLGPPSNPDYWLVFEDRLFLFHSATPFRKFMSQPAHNAGHAYAVWDDWFGGETDPATTPFDTACFCTEDTCADN